MYRFIGHVELTKFQTGIFVNGIKHPGLPFSTLNVNIHPGINAACNENMVNKNHQKAILTGRPIFLGEGVAAHLGRQTFCLPLHDVASHVRVKQLLN